MDVELCICILDEFIAVAGAVTEQALLGTMLTLGCQNFQRLKPV